MSFAPHPDLVKDGFVLAESDQYLLNIVNDSRYLWLILIPKVEGARDTFDLTEASQIQLTLLSNRIGQTISEEFNGDKFNVASLGNMVPQLHIHLIVRHVGDAAWPGPIWGVGEAHPYTEEQLNSVITRLAAVVDMIEEV